MEYNKTMDCPSNGVSIVGCLRPAFADEESYIRTLFHCVDSDGYNSDWKGILCFLPSADKSELPWRITGYMLGVNFVN
jgi:hypothetical protein